MKSISERVKEKPWLGWIIFLGTMILVFLLGLLASSIIERRTEAEFAYTPTVKYESWEPRAKVWGQNFPREYETYLQTKDTSFRSKYNGSALRDALEEDPRMIVLWAGYAFSKDYKQPRGHYYAIDDIRNTLRTGAPMSDVKSPQPNTCWTCKSPDVPRVMSTLDSVAKFYRGPWDSKGHEIVNAIGCADCHDAATMNLKITRPALVEAFQRMGKDITQATHQELRSLVCAQCHVEYYFNKHKVEGVAYVTFPWDNGFSAEEIEKYYDTIKFTDWTHSMSKTPMLKAQHPDYELYQMGTHASRGVSCADCHMPYISEGGQKFTDHHIQSPLNNVANSCQVCHREETAKLIADVYSRQDKIFENRQILEEQLVRAHTEAKLAWDKGASDKEMNSILQLIRQAQWRWDFTAASHGASFHAPVEVSRILGNGINKAQEARIILARVLATHRFLGEVPFPDISTKEKAQKFIGLDIPKLQSDKNKFIETVVPKWQEEAKKREDQYKVNPY